MANIKNSLAILLLILSFTAHAQTITTIAGTGTPGYTGDGFAATAATIFHPAGIAVDVIGNVYFSDKGNNCVRKIDTSGIITTIAGTGVAGYSGDGGPATAATLSGPIGLCLDPSGNIYVADNQFIRKIDVAGIITTFAGTTSAATRSGVPATGAYLANPRDITIDAGGNIWVNQLSYISKITPAGFIYTMAGASYTFGFSGDDGPATAATIDAYGIAVDGPGNVYIGDQTNNRIRKIDAGGIITTIAGSSSTSAFGGDGGPATAALLGGPSGLIVSYTGEILFCDGGNNRIRKITPDGTIYTVAGSSSTGGYGGDGGPATAAQFYNQSDLAIDCAGNLYISDTRNNRIRKIVFNHAPAFAGGAMQHMSICAGATVGIDTLLQIADADTLQTETWSLITAPLHGTAAVGYGALSTGSGIIPSGLTYTAPAGYYGTDTFSVQISDCSLTYTTTIAVQVDSLASAGAITGIDTLCMGAAGVTVHSTIPGGIWSAANGNATVAHDTVTAASVGIDTIIYTVTNACNSAATTHKVDIIVCPNSVATVNIESSLLIHPNPTMGSFSITIPSTTTQPAQVTVTDMVGKTITQINTTTNKKNEVTLQVPDGVYFITATTGGKKYYSKLVVAK